MEPSVRYARTTDGVRIAFSMVGSGPALVLLPGVPLDQFLPQWQIPEARAFFEALAQRLRVVQYDARGTGLSQRDLCDFSLEAMLLDLEAVVEHAGLDRFGLFGFWSSGLYAIAYAARHPERVSGLALWGAFAHATQVADSRQQALLSLIERDWDLFTETAAHLWLGWPAGGPARRVAEIFRTAVTPEQARAALVATASIDVTDLLPLVAAPTLVFLRQGVANYLAPARELAAAIPDARLVVLEGVAAAPVMPDPGPVVRPVLDLLAPETAPSGMPAAELQHPSGRDKPIATYPGGLTAREIEVLRLLAGGDSNREIASELGLSVHTVERHVANIYRKIGARGRADATAHALKSGLG